MQQEYQRRFDECRFLESQCRRLDVHCRLLEDRVSAAEASGTIPRSQPLSSRSIRQTDSPKAAQAQISPARAALHGALSLVDRWVASQ
ncbi:rplR [Symbiodinium sp. CCMP2592]|nr:rplR [Symbiodinium sp. CCMP2592]